MTQILPRFSWPPEPALCPATSLAHSNARTIILEQKGASDEVTQELESKLAEANAAAAAAADKHAQQCAELEATKEAQAAKMAEAEAKVCTYHVYTGTRCLCFHLCTIIQTDCRAASELRWL